MTKRVIAFRAWNKVEKVMYTNAINNCKDSFDMILKHPQIYEVMQCTGLKDKHGVEIYEGDIVEVNYTVKYIDPDKQDEEHTAIARVYWNDFRASFALEFHKFANDDLYRFVRDKYAEVIGNIHENPELLES